ncbi:hypothetical protein GF380_04105 [Candidatus Uhrbacteria bacterium]|nr:hypothetical protein [Candidatus Uhrbacteria bacterium]MBD3284267.1 hypothetical protein [Candidatus Uhrbacteria bacterium]
MKRLIISLMMLALAGSVLVPAASAATGPWSWHDISHRVTYQTQRPVWAVAWSEDGWFYTDGISLWDGGQVYWYDGTVSSIVTLDVRRENIDRVDDIVSDRAGTVLFLQDVVRFDNNFRIVAHRNGDYINYTNTVRSVFASNEGISSIEGRDGEWMIVTTKGRLFRWYGNTTPPQRISTPARFGAYPDAVRTLQEFQDNYLYSTNLGFSTSNSINVRVVPVGNEWLVVGEGPYDDVRDTYLYCYRFNGSTFTSITCPHPSVVTSSLHALQTNGEKALLFVHGNAAMGFALTAYEYTNGSFHEIEALSWHAMGSGFRGPLGEIDTNGANSNLLPFGSDWILLMDKHVIRITSTDVYDYGETRDLFLTGAADNDETLLLGGTYSALDRNEPTYPITAKLVKVIDDNGVSDGSNDPVDTNDEEPSGDHEGEAKIDEGNGIHTWQWLDPNWSEFKSNESVSYNVGAWDEDTIDRIEIIVNGEVKRTCHYNGGNDVECSHIIYASAYPKNTNIFVNAQVWDETGRYTFTDGKNVYHRGTQNDTSNNDNYEFDVWDSFSPNVSWIDRDEQLIYRASAWAKNGIQEIRIYADGQEVERCSYSQTDATRYCEYELEGRDWNRGERITLNARVRHYDGRTQWTDGRDIDMRDNDGSDLPDTDHDDPNPSSLYIWSDRDGGIRYGEQMTVYTNGSDRDGIDRIEIYVNAELVKTCYNTGSCSVTGGPYDQFPYVTYAALLVDDRGYRTWTGYTNVYR